MFFSAAIVHCVCNNSIRVLGQCEVCQRVIAWYGQNVRDAGGWICNFIAQEDEIRCERSKEGFSRKERKDTKLVRPVSQKPMKTICKARFLFAWQATKSLFLPPPKSRTHFKAHNSANWQRRRLQCRMNSNWWLAAGGRTKLIRIGRRLSFFHFSHHQRHPTTPVFLFLLLLLFVFVFAMPPNGHPLSLLPASRFVLSPSLGPLIDVLELHSSLLWWGSTKHTNRKRVPRHGP